MGLFSDEILAAAKEMKCDVTQLTSIEYQQLIAVLRDKFTDGKTSGWLWEHFLDDASIYDSRAWSLVDEFIGETNAIMLFDHILDRTGISFPSGSCVVSCLGETSGFEFYLTDREASYLLCFNHHDFLIGVGAAAEWIRRKIG